MIEAYHDGTQVRPWRNMEVLGTALPWLPQKFATHSAYAQAGVAEILGERASKATGLRTTWQQSTAFVNREGKFEVVALPPEAQFTPVFGISITDFDNDGFQDVALGQNFFGLREHDGALDAGRGLLLRGSADGKLNAVPGWQSGLVAYGEQRGLAAADFNHDGRMDLLMGQNGNQTKLWENRTGKGGIRLKLIGSPTNPDAYGARIEMDSGAAMEIRAGSGYWSQEAATKIIPAGTKSLKVRWPSGKSTTHPVPPNSTELLLREAKL